MATSALPARGKFLFHFQNDTEMSRAPKLPPRSLVLTERLAFV
jgi:hypothetical protein